MKLNSIKTILKIYHVSDIHIRLYKRYNEYAQVFLKLYSFFEQRQSLNSIILISGDLFHSKTLLSPLAVKLAKDFIDTLSKYMPVIIFAGNHDGNINNKHRLDSITPIIDLHNNNIQYLVLTKVYNIKNIAFYLCSVYDLKILDAKLLNDLKIKIFLYHGIVDKISLLTGLLLNNAMKKLMFDGYDYVMLGDIHKHQVLQSKHKNKPYIAYPGSLIQQSFGELQQYHGLMEWNLLDLSYVYHLIQNDYGYVTILLDLNHLLNEYYIPKKPRIRIKYKFCSELFLNEYISNLKKNYLIQLLHLIDVSNKYNDNTINTLLIVDNINDVNYQSKLITDFCYNTDLFNITLTDLKLILLINKAISDSVNVVQNKHIIWKPLLMRFSNMFSYGLNNIVDFRNLKGNVGIIGPNRVGKSSIIDILLFTLFDKTSRAYKANSIINVLSDYFNCLLDFLINGKRYKIEKNAIRRVNKRKQSQFDHVPVQVKFYLISINDLLIDISGIDRDLTNRIIQLHIGTYNDFVMNTISIQNDHLGFLKLSQTLRKKFLSRILNVEVFLSYFNASKLIIKKLNLTVSDKQYGDITLQISILSTEIYDLTALHLNQKKDLNALNKDHKKLVLKYKKLLASYKNILKFLHNIDSILRLITILQNKIASVLNSLIDIKSDLLKDLILTENLLLSLIKTIDKNINTIKINIANYKNLINNNLTLSKLLFNDDCEHCSANKKLLISLKLLKLLLHAKLNIKKLQSILDLYMLNSKLANDLHKQVKLKINSIHLNKLKQDQIYRLSAKLLQAIKIKNRYYLLLNDLTYNKLILNKLHLIKKLIKDLLKKIDITKSNVIRLEISILSKNKKIVKLLTLLKLYLQRVLKLRLYLLYNTIMSKLGIQYHVIYKTIPLFLNKVNLILSLMCDFSVLFLMDGKDIDILVKNNLNLLQDKYWPILLCSGLLKFILSIAIRTAISLIGNLPKSLFLALDEGFGNIDQLNMASIGNIFYYLKNIYKYILIISHINTIKNLIDSYILINKDVYSYVNNKNGA